MYGARGNIDGWGTMLQTVMTLVSSPDEDIEFT
jgi:hypothetical protein